MISILRRTLGKEKTKIMLFGAECSTPKLIRLIVCKHICRGFLIKVPICYQKYILKLIRETKQDIQKYWVSTVKHDSLQKYHQVGKL